MPHQLLQGFSSKTPIATRPNTLALHFLFVRPAPNRIGMDPKKQGRFLDIQERSFILNQDPTSLYFTPPIYTSISFFH